jgi:hypothetical protein
MVPVVAVSVAWFAVGSTFCITIFYSHGRRVVGWTASRDVLVTLFLLYSETGDAVTLFVWQLFGP